MGPQNATSKKKQKLKEKLNEKLQHVNAAQLSAK